MANKLSEIKNRIADEVVNLAVIAQGGPVINKREKVNSHYDPLIELVKYAYNRTKQILIRR